MEINCCYLFYIDQSEKLSDSFYSSFLQQLPIRFQKEIHEYKHWQAAQNSLLGKIILQYAFKKLELSYTLDAIKIGMKDRPFLESTIDFNISHSGNIIMVGLMQQAKIGVDVEKHRPIKIDLFKKYFSDFEWDFIQLSKDKNAAFFNIWTMKESAIKCDGRGVEILSKTYLENNHQHKIKCDGNEFYYQAIFLEDDYTACVCSSKKYSIEIKKLTLNDLSIVFDK